MTNKRNKKKPASRLGFGFAVGVAGFDGSEIQLGQARFDLGAVADGDDEHLLRGEIFLGHGLRGGGSDGIELRGELGVVVEAEVVHIDVGVAAGGVGTGFKEAGERADLGSMLSLSSSGVIGASAMRRSSLKISPRAAAVTSVRTGATTWKGPAPLR